MKRILFPVLAASASLLALSAHAADDNSGQIKFVGQLTAPTCAIDVNGTDSSSLATITLPTISTSELTSKGATAGKTDFQINLKGCASTAKTASATFQPAGGLAAADGSLLNTLSGQGAATNVALQLWDPIKAAQVYVGSASQQPLQTVLQDGQSPIAFSVQYLAQNDKPTAGAISATVTYSVAYQ